KSEPCEFASRRDTHRNGAFDIGHQCRYPMHINLDDFLDTGSGRIWTVERNAEAWKRSFAAFAIALEQATQKTTVYVLVGAQASGKTTWARAKAAEDPNAILFDAIFVKKSERLPILKSARGAGVPG